jgi:hypothetical protein
MVFSIEGLATELKILREIHYFKIFSLGFEKSLITTGVAN